MGKTKFKQRRFFRARRNLFGLSKPSMRRLARRGGVKRMLESTHEAMAGALSTYLREVLGSAVSLVKLSDRKTVMHRDVVEALRVQNRTLYSAQDAVLCSSPWQWHQHLQGGDTVHCNWGEAFLNLT